MENNYEKKLKELKELIEGNTQLNNDDMQTGIYGAISVRKEREEAIKNKENELREVVNPLVFEEKKAELDKMKNLATELNEMTGNSLKYAKKEILSIRAEAEKEWQQMLLNTLKKQKEIERKKESLLSDKNLSDEKRVWAENSAKKALDKINNELNEFKTKYSEQMSNLAKWEEVIDEEAHNIGINLDGIKPEVEAETNKLNNQEVKSKEMSEGNKKENTQNKNSNENKVKGKKIYDWHPKLTQEQKDDLIAEGIKPGDPEYFSSLRNYGIKDDGPFHIEDDNKNKSVNNEKDGFQPPAVVEPKGFQPPAVVEPKGFQPPAVAEPKKDLPAKTGLQIFRDEFNKMPDIKNIHTLTERLPLPATLGTVAGIGLLGINPFVGIPVATASLLARPIVYRLTGQKKLEDEITKQFLEMKREDLGKMVDYLSEENIQDLKPNAVILRALNKAQLKVTREDSKVLQEEMDNLKNERQSLYDKENLTEDEKNRLIQVNNRIKEINEKEAPQVERRLKDVKRGKDRVSQRYKGNLATRFNIFAHRNTTSEEYYPILNQYANGEMFRDVAELEGNAKSQAEGQMLMEHVMEENTHTNKLGVQNSVFNKRNNVVRIMSDRLDNTTRYIGRIGTIAVGSVLAGLKLKEFENAQEINAAEHNKNVQDFENLRTNQEELLNGNTISKDLAQKVADEQKTIASAYGESAALHNTGSTRAANYYEQDQLTQDQLADVGKEITEKDASGILQQLAEAVRSKNAATSRLNNEALSKIDANNWKVDHTEQLASQVNAVEQSEATADLYEKLSDIIGKVQNLKIPSMSNIHDNFVRVTNSFVGPIMTGIGVGLGIGKDMLDSNKEAKHNRETNIIAEQEENNEDIEH